MSLHFNKKRCWSSFIFGKVLELVDTDTANTVLWLGEMEQHSFQPTKKKDPAFQMTINLENVKT